MCFIWVWSLPCGDMHDLAATRCPCSDTEVWVLSPEHCGCRLSHLTGGWELHDAAAPASVSAPMLPPAASKRAHLRERGHIQAGLFVQRLFASECEFGTCYFISEKVTEYFYSIKWILLTPFTCFNLSMVPFDSVWFDLLEFGAFYVDFQGLSWCFQQIVAQADKQISREIKVPICYCWATNVYFPEKPPLKSTGEKFPHHSYVSSISDNSCLPRPVVLLIVLVQHTDSKRDSQRN